MSIDDFHVFACYGDHGKLSQKREMLSDKVLSLMTAAQKTALN